MIVQTSFLKKIKDFGLNSYEAKLWTALLSRGISTAGELSDIAGVPRSRSYDVLESLEKKGFIIMKIDKPIKYIAVSPAEVLDRVKKKVQIEANDQVKILDELDNSEVLKELSLLHNQGVEMVDPTDMTGVVKGRELIYDHLNTMIKDAKESIVLATTEDGLIRKSDALKRNLKKAKSKGVKVRIMAPLTAKNKKHASSLKEFGEVKHAKDVQGRFMLVDNESLAFMLQADDKVHPSYDVGVWVIAPLFGKTVSDMFEKVWKESKA
ncbi:MAG: helix-turn-helix domain-containing protein [archaeon]